MYTTTGGHESDYYDMKVLYYDMKVLYSAHLNSCSACFPSTTHASVHLDLAVDSWRSWHLRLEAMQVCEPVPPARSPRCPWRSWLWVEASDPANVFDVLDKFAVSPETKPSGLSHSPA